MKFSAAVLALVAGVASAGKPQLSLRVRDGSFDGLEGLDPTIAWENENQSGDLDISYGVKASVRPTSDLASLPRDIWGKVKTDVSGWGVSARASTHDLNFDNARLDLEADNEDADLNVQVAAAAGRKDFSVERVQATKGMDVSGARVTVTPRFNLANDDRDVVATYDNGKTNVRVTASADEQEVSVSQQIDDENRINPTINSNGDMSLAWERKLTDDSSLTTTLRPNDNVNVEWKDSDWTANIRMPVDGTNIKGADVSIRRDVNF